MRDRRRLFYIGLILLTALMFSGVLELGVVARASTLPHEATIVSISTAGTCSTDTGGVAYADGIVSWHQQYATHIAKYPKVKSTLPCQRWEPSLTLIASSRRAYADIPLHVFADTYCYAIHPRPPTVLTAA